MLYRCPIWSGFVEESRQMQVYLKSTDTAECFVAMVTRDNKDQDVVDRLLEACLEVSSCIVWLFNECTVLGPVSQRNYDKKIEEYLINFEIIVHINQNLAYIMSNKIYYEKIKIQY